MKVGLVQFEMSPSAAENRARAAVRIREAAAKGAQVICLPELYHCPYFCQVQDPALFDLAEPLSGPNVSEMAALAGELGVVLIVPFFERVSSGLYYNSAAVVDADGRVLGSYRKMHIPQDPGFEEKFYFTPGDKGFAAWETRFGRIGVLICWDQWFPEAARLTAMRGADLLFYPTAIGWLPSEKPTLGTAQHCAWETVQRGHAVANGCHVVAVNRVGTETPPVGEVTEFWGQSFVANPYGEIIERMSARESGVSVVSIDLAKQQEMRRIWPFFRDRRIDAYSDLQRRWVE